jgi:hypothetical protein
MTEWQRLIEQAHRNALLFCDMLQADPELTFEQLDCCAWP